MTEEFKPTKFEQELIDTPLTEADHRVALIGSVEHGLKEYFIRRAGDDCAAYNKDGEIGVRLNGVYSLDEMMFHIVSAITGKTIEELFGKDTEIKF